MPLSAAIIKRGAALPATEMALIYRNSRLDFSCRGIGWRMLARCHRSGVFGRSRSVVAGMAKLANKLADLPVVVDDNVFFSRSS